MPTLYLDFDAESLAELNQSEISIEELVAQTGITAQIRLASLPITNPNSRSKDLVTTIAVSGVAIAGLIGAISHLMQTIFQRPRLIDIEQYEELRDAKGNIAFDQDGQPIFKLVKQIKLLEVQQASITELEGKAGPIVIKFQSGNPK